VEVAMLAAPIQTTLDEGVPLSEVTFCVVDLETTGGSPTDARITEIGAVKIRGGERLGTFQTLVDPGTSIPEFIARLTGIDDRTVAGQPPIEAALPAFLEFARGCVFVAHNASFDLGFVNAEAARLDYPEVDGPPVCTAKLAKRLVWPDVPNLKLATLSSYFRTRATPCHRALADAEAAAEVLDGLLDVGGRLGILTLGDLREACRARGRPNYGKIRLADHLPASPGVYLFRGGGGQVLYVGKSKDLRTRVKSYFYGDGRKKVQDLLAEVGSIDGIPCGGELEALVLEARLIRSHEPPYNRRGRTWRRYAYLKVDPTEAWPRLKVVGQPTAGREAVYLGPFANRSAASLAKEALEEVFPIRRCTASMGRSTRFSPCALAEMGRCQAPCDGRTDPERYGELVRELLSSLHAPGGLLGALEARMRSLADQERFEEAASVRDRLRSLAEALARARQESWIVGAGALVLRTSRGEPSSGITAAGSSDARGTSLRFLGGSLLRGDAAEPFPTPCPRERADELAAVRSWIAANRPQVEACDVPPCEPVAGGRELAVLLRSLRDHDRSDRSIERQGSGRRR
jgi:DNA polymerase-3 subunit epsilon